MTVKKYEENVDVLSSEKQEIVARLNRVKAEMDRQKK